MTELLLHVIRPVIVIIATVAISVALVAFAGLIYFLIVLLIIHGIFLLSILFDVNLGILGRIAGLAAFKKSLTGFLGVYIKTAPSIWFLVLLGLIIYQIVKGGQF